MSKGPRSQLEETNTDLNLDRTAILLLIVTDLNENIKSLGSQTSHTHKNVIFTFEEC